MNPTGPSQPNSSTIRVAAICGSFRSGSYTRQALTIALQGAEEVGAQTHLLDLRDYRLMFCGDEETTLSSQDIIRLREDVGAAQGIILGTPEYHGGYSGVLKNALDLLTSKELAGKVIGLVGVAGGALGANNALNGLRTVGRSLQAWVIPEQASVPEAHNAFNHSGRLRNLALESRLQEIGRKVARFAYLHTSHEAKELLTAWEATNTTMVGI